MEANKVYLVTGGCGSLGQALIPELLKSNPQSIRLFDNHEQAHWETKRRFTDSRLRFFIGDIRDGERLRRAMEGVSVVIHAAALKHVDLCEYNPIEAVETNINGSKNIITAALDCHVPKVLGISSDKAVHPISLYGATKLVMEKLFIEANVYGKSLFSCIRYGNFGGRGSILPLWYQQLTEGNPLTVTDKDMTRFCITLESVSRFVLTCIDIMKGNEIFVPKMSEKSILEFLKEIVPTAEIEIIGKRPGEKLHELLFAEGESPVDMGDYFVLRTER